MNTALLLEDFREIRQWQDATPNTRSIWPERLHSIFEQRDQIAFADLRRLVPQEFKASHPSLEARGREGGGEMASLSEFRSLLRSMCSGILESAPWHPDKLILGGSALPCCMRRLTQEQRSLCHKEIKATRDEAQLQKWLWSKIGGAASTVVMWMAFGCREMPGDWFLGEASSAAGLRRAIRRDLLSKPWEDADIDLFVLAEDAELTIKQTLSVIQRNISWATGGRESVVLQTRNTLTVVGGWPLPNIQIVCKTVRSLQELLVHSDVDCTALAYDGKRIMAATRALRALVSGFNFLPKQVLTGAGPRNGRSVARFAKYYRRGFGILVFEHCRHLPRCDHSLSPGSFDKVHRAQVLKEPQTIKGTPKEKGRTLASWMLARVPELRLKAEPDVEEGLSSGAVTDVQDVRSHRLVPGDLVHAKPNDTKDRGADDELQRRNRPWSNYRGFVDIVIPCGPKVCPESLREYVRHLGRPDLLREFLQADILVGQKKSSDRQQWQDRARGKCYMCKVAVRAEETWPMCESCRTFNMQKQNETVDCTGMVAVVTGGRAKIGRECALRLLRNGATVVVTSRFPHCARDRYSQERDFASFSKRLIVVGADFRRLSTVQHLVDLVLERFQQIHVLIHNAAQTIRRPPAYYEALIRRENQLQQVMHAEAFPVSGEHVDDNFVTEALSLLPANLSLQRPLMPGDEEAELKKGEWFPEGQTDAHGEQLDLRSITSWTQKLEDTEMPELTEVLSVNLVVPYLLTARWSPLLRKAPCAFVVFVSSQEGAFTTPSGSKHHTHPHTNVAKAGLNMLARTIASDLRRDAVFTSAVDPGWVSWMKPGGSQKVEGAPLTEADGAARVLDPIFSGMQALKNGLCPPSGVLFKDFRVSPW
eukprot:TRINITY_DN6399_c0_g1_i2.p1 TRINITY_DN6399_c0_g1~~TRINITY_DN6399_c0_g1_i2.p1  ORF type:complete len:1004 (-),score=137.03 TRINITY_DN6399_c0_g1_i2:391-3018(-)